MAYVVQPNAKQHNYLSSTSPFSHLLTASKCRIWVKIKQKLEKFTIRKRFSPLE